MYTIESYISSLKEKLYDNSDKLSRNIQATCDFNYSKDIDLLDYSIFMQSFNLSIMMFSMDKYANEVFYEGNKHNIFAGSYEILADIVYYNLLDEEYDEFWEFYEQNDVELSKKEKEVIVEWFVACWNNADGQNVKLPAYFCFHDDDKSYDLQKNKWINDEEKWSE